MAYNILVWIESFKGHAAALSYECLGEARRLADGGTVTAAVFGENAASIASEAITLGADKAIVCEDASLNDFRAEPYTALLTKIAIDLKPDVIMAGASTRGRDLVSGLAVELETGTIADCTSIEVKDGQIVVTRPVFAGKLLATLIVPSKRPIIITTRSRAFAMPMAEASHKGEVTKVNAVMSEDQIISKITGFEVEGEGEVSLNDARVIVAGGRGVGGPEGFAPITALARALGAAVGASRAAVDAGWIPYTYQVGQTGKTVGPDLYIACGISGAIQHQAGMRTAKVIVAINKDADAPIFKLARYGVVGDLFQIVPALTEEFKKRLGK
ncbi:MAG TPA: electron transfer flavoprotein subunit alpha/FixB family protein [Anaerolineae bacterium]|nr:electron transfer flavoprotein subunit alpha/FixB family protein [Anaerolineae bacterium]